MKRGEFSYAGALRVSAAHADRAGITITAVKSHGGLRRSPASRRRFHAAASKLVNSSNAKCRERPGISPAAISAASMTNVPDPHIGSTTGSRPLYPHSCRKSAASVSLIGALLTACLCPRLCSRSPDVSMPTVQMSFSMRALTQTPHRDRTERQAPRELLARCVALRRRNDRCGNSRRMLRRGTVDPGAECCPTPLAARVCRVPKDAKL